MTLRDDAAAVHVRAVHAHRESEIVEVVCEAFHEYPVMRFVLGEAAEEYDARLRTLVRFFVGARLLRGEPVLAIEAAGRPVAAALASRPSRPSPSEVADLRESTWIALGPDARRRYEAFGAACARFHLDEEHLHLNMVAVAPRAQGRGLGRKLIEHVHALSRRDGVSCGVTLTTEDPNNVPLYQHLGYRIVGETVVSPELTTWGFYRPN